MLSQISFDPLLPSPAAECRSQFILHRPARLELRFQFSTGLPTGWRVGLFNLWIQVQKETKPVDFTMCCALIELTVLSFDFLELETSAPGAIARQFLRFLVIILEGSAAPPSRSHFAIPRLLRRILRLEVAS
jgi:hypothetical protein